MRAAQIVADMGFDGSVVLFSWPSAGELTGYIRDQQTARNTGWHLLRLLRELIPQAHPDRIHVIAHSMGSEVLSKAISLIDRADTLPRLAQVAFAAPDVDARIFAREILPMLARHAHARHALRLERGRRAPRLARAERRLASRTRRRLAHRARRDDDGRRDARARRLPRAHALRESGAALRPLRRALGRACARAIDGCCRCGDPTGSSSGGSGSASPAQRARRAGHEASVHYAEYPPPPALAGVVRCFWHLRGEAAHDGGEADPALPDGSPELILNFGDPFEHLVEGRRPRRQPAAFLVGQITAPMRVRPTGTTHLIAVRFEAHGAAMLHRPMHALTDGWVAAPEVAPGLVRTMEALGDRPSAERAIGAIGAELGRIRESAQGADERIARAVQAIRAQHGATSPEELAREAGLTLRSLQRRFADEVGVSPKLLARIVRFQRGLRGPARRTRLVGAHRGGVRLLRPAAPRARLPGLRGRGARAPARGDAGVHRALPPPRRHENVPRLTRIRASPSGASPSARARRSRRRSSSRAPRRA